MTKFASWQLTVCAIVAVIFLGTGADEIPTVVDVTSSEFSSADDRYKVLKVQKPTLNGDVGKSICLAMKTRQADVRKRVDDSKFHVKFILKLVGVNSVTGMSDSDPAPTGIDRLDDICRKCHFQFAVIGGSARVQSFLKVVAKDILSVASNVNAAREKLDSAAISPCSGSGSDNVCTCD